jgi:GNAT superfamily N-acetyltransferase
MAINFKLAQPQDVETLVRFMRQLFETDNPSGEPFNEPKERTAVAGLIDDPTFGRVWLIVDDDRPVGYVVLTLGYSLEYHGKDSFLDELFIIEPYRGQGIGKMAVELVEETCRKLGVNALHLEVERSNLRAKKLYQKMEFMDHDRYLMTKWLTD